MSMVNFNAIIVVVSAVSTVVAINRPVYKVVLTQKGYAQFLQYDIDTPPLREFTFCSWFRINDLQNAQTLFTYVTIDNHRLVRLWLDSYGSQIKVSIDEKVTSSAPIILVKDVWRHVCLSYQSDYGALAVYVDSRLISCESSQTLHGFILPGGGSVIVGYGTSENGAQQGLEGEVFGANMILKSTIERNYTLKNNPLYVQKPFHKNKLKYGGHNMHYIVLSDLLTEELNNNIETTDVPASTPSISQFSKSFIRLKTPHSFIEHPVGSDLKTTPSISPTSTVNDKDFLNFFVTDKHTTSRDEASGSKNMKLPTLSEYEVPPPPSQPPTLSVFEKLTRGFSLNSMTRGKSMYEVNESSTENMNKYPEELYEVEMPPPEEKNPKVYGQWTSSKFAGNVFQFIKNKNLRTREQKMVIPQTIPLTKISDSFPYPSDFRVLKVPPLVQFQRRNIVEKQLFDTKKTPQINLQILGDDLRSNILKHHSQNMPVNVEISNRGKSNSRQDRRFSRDVNNPKVNQESYENTKETFRSKPIQLSKTKKNKSADLHHQYLMTILPFLKSLEYFMGDSRDTELITQADSQESKNIDVTNTNISKNNDVYARSLSLGNKWHNVKSYNNDYTPREIKIGFSDNNGARNIDEKIAEVNKKNPGIRLRYRHKNRRGMQHNDNALLKGRALAMQVSNQSNTNRDSVSILKYNKGFLSSKNVKSAEKYNGERQVQNVYLNIPLQNNFHKQVKIGNALNEQPVIGESVEQNKRSFIGGDDSIPDINKYKGEKGTKNMESVPKSLGPRICKNLELYDRVLYVQPDESIDMSHIMSPVRLKNIGIEFIIQNYKKCSLQESNLQNNEMLFIDWSKTPVRLFGGAYPRKTTDLCGFF